MWTTESQTPFNQEAISVCHNVWMAESLQQENLHRVICLFSLVALNCISIYSPMLRPCWVHAAPMLRPPGVPSPPKNVAEKSLEKRDGRLEFVKDILGIFRGHLQAAQV